VHADACLTTLLSEQAAATATVAAVAEPQEDVKADAAAPSTDSSSDAAAASSSATTDNAPAVATEGKHTLRSSSIIIGAGCLLVPSIVFAWHVAVAQYAQLCYAVPRSIALQRDTLLMTRLELQRTYYVCIN
jgi:hypothetical protein